MANKRSITSIINTILEESKCGVTINGPERWDPQIEESKQEELFKWILRIT